MMIVYQGEIAIDGSTVITCTTNNMTIYNIIITNLTTNYTLTVNRISNNLEELNSVPLCEFQLDAGDTVKDGTSYLFNKGDSLQLISDVLGTTFYVNALTR